MAHENKNKNKDLLRNIFSCSWMLTQYLWVSMALAWLC